MTKSKASKAPVAASALPDPWALLRALCEAFDHVATCRECGEMSLESCASAGGHGAEALSAREKAADALRAATEWEEGDPEGGSDAA